MPSVSVVVASGAGGEFLFRCLDSLKRQVHQTGAELIVPDRLGNGVRLRLAREYPWVRVLPLGPVPRPTIPAMRRHAAEAASGDIVAVLEEHCTAPPDWLTTIQSVFRLHEDVAIGGPILDSAFTRARDWCVYFSEYHNYLPPWSDVDRFLLNGANIAYRRQALLAHRDRLDDGYWEVVLHPVLAKEGRFRAVDAMGVRHTGPFDYGYYLRQRYLLSRVWGGTERARAPVWKRLAHLAVGPIFPLLLFARVTSRVLERPRYVRPYVRCLPLLVPAWFAYAWGEWLGYLAGPGRALEEVE